MNSWEKEQAEQEAADQAEERRVAREDKLWEEAQILRDHESDLLPSYPAMPPYLFADERSQRRVEEEARQERPLDDYGTWTGQNEQLFR